jgi:hypothetical protein
MAPPESPPWYTKAFPKPGCAGNFVPHGNGFGKSGKTPLFCKTSKETLIYSVKNKSALL